MKSNGSSSNPSWANVTATSASKLNTDKTITVDLASTTGVTYTGESNITPGVTGTLPISHGGTGNTSYTNKGIIKYDDLSSKFVSLAPTDPD